MQPADPLFADSSNLPVAEPADTTAPVAPLVAAPASEVPLVAFFAHGLWNLVLPLMFFLSIVVLVAYTAPFLLTHWRLTEAQAEAEATFLKRRAELKAEAE